MHCNECMLCLIYTSHFIMCLLHGVTFFKVIMMTWSWKNVNTLKIQCHMHVDTACHTETLHKYYSYKIFNIYSHYVTLTFRANVGCRAGLLLAGALAMVDLTWWSILPSSTWRRRRRRRSPNRHRTIAGLSRTASDNWSRLSWEIFQEGNEGKRLS